MRDKKILLVKEMKCGNFDKFCSTWPDSGFPQLANIKVKNTASASQMTLNTSRVHNTLNREEMTDI
jgi:hypothetical protein